MFLGQIYGFTDRIKIMTGTEGACGRCSWATAVWNWIRAI